MSDDTRYIEVTSVPQFMEMTTAWHTQKVKELEHTLKVPSGTEMEIANENGKTTILVLEEDALAGFKAGIDVALMALGTLPFSEMPPEPAPKLTLVSDAPP